MKVSSSESTQPKFNAGSFLKMLLPKISKKNTTKVLDYDDASQTGKDYTPKRDSEV